MATISSLHLYPVKSCRGIELAAARLGAKGLEAHGLGDRQWAIVGAAGNVLTQREHPALALIEPRPTGEGVALAAPGLATFTVSSSGVGAASLAVLWGSALKAIDEGEDAAQRLSAYLGVPARLVRFDEQEKRPSDPGRTGGIEGLNRFSDGYPILLLSLASLANLNQRWTQQGHAPLPMNRFRPNVVLGGIGPYEEDHLASLEHAEFALKPVKPCPRCSIPSVDQSTAVVGPAPLELLASYRFDAQLQGAVLGQNAVVSRGLGAMLRVGQRLETHWNF